MNANLKTTTVTQLGNKELGTPEKKLHYLIIETKIGKHVINVGEKTNEAVNKILDKIETEEGPITKNPTKLK